MASSEKTAAAPKDMILMPTKITQTKHVTCIARQGLLPAKIDSPKYECQTCCQFFVYEGIGQFNIAGSIWERWHVTCSQKASNPPSNLQTALVKLKHGPRECTPERFKCKRSSNVQALLCKIGWGPFSQKNHVIDLLCQK
eukprot:196917-Amphidinium_carterae.2